MQSRIGQVIMTLMAVTTLGACDRTENKPGPGGITEGEARELDEAAAELEARDRQQPADADQKAAQ